MNINVRNLLNVLAVTSAQFVLAMSFAQAGTNVSVFLNGDTGTFTNWGTHQICPDDFDPSCSSNEVQSSFGAGTTGTFDHQHYFLTPATASNLLEGGATATSNKLLSTTGVTILANVSGTLSLFRDLGVAGTADLGDTMIASATFFSATQGSGAGQGQFYVFNLAANEHYYYRVQGTVTGLSNTNNYTINSTLYPSASAVPEPSEWLMMLLGLGITGAIARRKNSIKK